MPAEHRWHFIAGKRLKVKGPLILNVSSVFDPDGAVSSGGAVLGNSNCPISTLNTERH